MSGRDRGTPSTKATNGSAETIESGSKAKSDKQPGKGPNLTGTQPPRKASGSVGTLASGKKKSASAKKSKQSPASKGAPQPPAGGSGADEVSEVEGNGSFMNEHLPLGESPDQEGSLASNLSKRLGLKGFPTAPKRHGPSGKERGKELKDKKGGHPK